MGWRVADTRAWVLAACGLAVLGILTSHPAARAGPVPGSVAHGWIAVDYTVLVDSRSPTHSGESIGTILGRLGGRPLPPTGERPEDGRDHRLLDPLLEPYGFVLSDAVDSIQPMGETPRVEIGWLFAPGDAQPAWAELLRARRYVVESDGHGSIRVFAPLDDRPADRPLASDGDASEASELAWRRAWPILRHVLARERARLGGANVSGLDLEVHAYVAEPARARFLVALDPFRARVTDTGPPSDRVPLDLEALRSFFVHGWELEGGKLDPEGGLRLVGSETRQPGTLLGRGIGLDDLAVAYRAVMRGGPGEPYMSLDPGESPHRLVVNYAGRLHDTRLGLVTLLCDVRFKTFSVGLGILEDTDLRDTLRRSVPGFMTHLERFAADPRTRGMTAQHTRLWFYPDDVDVALSQALDAILFRRARMTAASERLAEAELAASRLEEAPWTRATIEAVNRDYDALSRIFPELGGLDQVARLLTLATWLRQASESGLRLPDLDAMLDVDLPPVPTPRSFPLLLAYNVLPEAGRPDGVEVLQRATVVDALDRLAPSGSDRLPARRRLRRVIAMLDRRQGDHAALIRDAEAALATDASDESLDRLAFRAERLLTHHLVLRGGPQSERESLLRREAAPGEPRVFSLGIGGLDLGMARVLARASREGARLSWGSPTLRGAGSRPSAGEALRANVTSTKAALESRHETAAGLPEHGLIDTSSPEAERAFGGNWIRKAVRRAGDASYPTIEIVMSADGPDPRARRIVQDLSGRARWIQRVEAGRFLSYAFERTDSGLRAVRSVPLVAPADRERGVPISDAGSPRAIRPSAKNPSRYAILEILPPPLGERTVSSTADPDVDSPDIVLRLRSAGRSDREASFPRAVLQRIVLGPEVDLSAGRPLPGLGEPSLVLGDADVLLVMLSPEQTSPPWVGPTPPIPGEENPVRVAESLGRWWAATAKESARPVVVATDRERSPSRWLDAAGPLRKPLLLAPDDAFPAMAAPIRDRLAGVWRCGPIASALPKRVPGRLVVLASAEAPARLGERVRSLANDPRLSGKLLAVISLSGAIRQDLPASLLTDGRLAGIGIAQSGPDGWERVASGLGEFSAALAEGPSTIERVESVRGPFLWYF